MERDMQNTNVFVLYGALRSGTTLLRLMLDGHPDICCPGERDFLIDHIDGSGKIDLDRLRSGRIFKASGLASPNTNEGPAALQQMLAEDIEKSGRVRAHVIVLHRGLRHFLPAMRVPVIHLVRDPRDVARSSMGMGWAGNTYCGVQHWLDTETQWDRLDPAPETHTIRYEDLLQRPEEVLAQLCAFMGCDFDHGMLGYHQHSTYSEINHRLAYQWRQKLSASAIADVEHRVGPLLRDRGYEPSGHPVRPPGKLRTAKLRLSNKVGVWRWMVNRHGPIDPLLRGLSRRLGLTRAETYFQGRMDATTIRHLK